MPNTELLEAGRSSDFVLNPQGAIPQDSLMRTLVFAVVSTLVTLAAARRLGTLAAADSAVKIVDSSRWVGKDVRLKCEARSHECERCTHECVRHGSGS